MTKEEIVKALRYCADGESCIDCIYPNMGLPYLPCYQKDKDAADLIEAQAAEIEKLKAQVRGGFRQRIRFRRIKRKCLC